MKYVKIISEKIISTDVPKMAKYNNKIYIGKLPEEYLKSIGFYPLVESDKPEPQDGYHIEARYSLVDEKVVETWVQVENPPPVKKTEKYSKFKMVEILTKLGLWTSVKEWIDQNGLTDLYLAASDFSNDNEYFLTGVEQLKTQLGVSDYDVKKILTYAKIK